MRNRTLVLFIITILTVMLIGCSKPKTAEIAKATKGSSQIIGQIVSIDKLKLSTDANSPCSKFPCNAKVRVDSVLSIGQGGPLLQRDDTLNVHFSFTLGETTEELFPNLKVRMPGLEIDSKFISNIKLIAGKTSSTPAKYQIDTYQKVLKNN